ncbi:hypothetical protein DdX_05640 [Ditylenchus destructor]|uniref:Uncharacterized protein n=1 Tax=Ditylenchus destructor TaxID=166010 RepID=A0AAD4ND08_9BILA|nr:hypothetical protein DdX_05640 [Ditylenchus destructor]
MVLRKNLLYYPKLFVIIASLYCVAVIDGAKTAEKVTNDNFGAILEPEIGPSSNKTISAPFLREQAKLQRLKELRAEVKHLSSQFQQRRHRKHKGSPLTAQKQNPVDKEQNATNPAPAWRSKMRHKIRALNRRMRRLEKQIKQQKKALKFFERQHSEDDFKGPVALTQERIHSKNRRRGHRRKNSHRIAANSTDTDKTISESSKNSSKTSNKMLEALNKARLMSKQGEAGSACLIHKECKPGLCCHRTNTTSHCVLYALKEGLECEHSCACESQLHCFRDQNHALVSRTAHVNVAKCKKAQANDFLTGIYENSNESYFTGDGEPKNKS